MMSVWDSLQANLLRGHRQLAEGLSGTIAVLERGDFGTAAKLADELDRDAGPHVEFQERYLFPVVEEQQGEAIAVKLYDELGSVVATLMELQRLSSGLSPSATMKRRWLRSLRRGLRHLRRTRPMFACLAEQPIRRKAELLRRHERLRRRPHRWSQLHPSLQQ